MIEDLSFLKIFGSNTKNKIILLLVKERELNISKIIEKIKANHKIVSINLQFLKEIGLIQEKIFGRIKIYRYKEENMKAKAIKNIIKLLENDYYNKEIDNYQ